MCQHDSRSVGCVAGTSGAAQGERAHQVSGYVEFEFGVDLDGLGRLSRQGDAFVDVDQQVLHLQGQAVDADHGRAGRRGLQAGKAAFDICRVADQG